MNNKAIGVALACVLLLVGGFGLGAWTGKVDAENKAREAWLAQPAYEYYKILDVWDVYGVRVSNETIEILWYNATDWGMGIWERDDPYFIIEKGSGETVADWFALQTRDIYTHLNNGKDVLKGTYWVLVI
jgi:hypothetical protein